MGEESDGGVGKGIAGMFKAALDLGQQRFHLLSDDTQLRPTQEIFCY
jgi:hypothetical protein